MCCPVQICYTRYKNDKKNEDVYIVLIMAIRAWQLYKPYVISLGILSHMYRNKYLFICLHCSSIINAQHMDQSPNLWLLIFLMDTRVTAVCGTAAAYNHGNSLLVISRCCRTLACFFAPYQLDPRIRDQLRKSPQTVMNFVWCRRAIPSHITQDLVTVTHYTKFGDCYTLQKIWWLLHGWYGLHGSRSPLPRKAVKLNHSFTHCSIT